MTALGPIADLAMPLVPLLIALGSRLVLDQAPIPP
jgi:hypothetical protein